MFATVLALALAFGASVVASSSPAVICVAGQCLEGYSNTTLGATLSSSDVSTRVLLLPGQYTSTTSPQLLQQLLTSSSATLFPSPGFANSSASVSVSLPLTVQLQPGLATYPQARYSGNASFKALPSTAGNISTPLNAGSLAISNNVWAAVSTGNNNRVILWSSVPDVAQLPTSASGSLSLLALESSTCSPPCAGNAVCTTSGTCSCPTGFSGSSCEQCASGYYGPSCSSCPSGCTTCDDGISGTGRCLSSTVSNPPSSCNCINGQCGSGGQCTCLPGWSSASNGTQCATCAPGYFLGSTGNCEVCQLGCAQCAAGSGDCTQCKSGFIQDPNDHTKCINNQKTSSGQACGSNSYSVGSGCQTCASQCASCTGGGADQCVQCAIGTYSLNGTCVQTNSVGVCQGTSLIGNPPKGECDSCPPKCTACQIPNFSTGSLVSQAQCTGCLPGYVLYQGQCLASCPSGTFLSPTDNLTCTACDSSCSTCAGSSGYCLTCAGGLLASNGRCVNSCPLNTFNSNRSCVPCHPDCATCTGNAFNQCSSCAKNLPVLTGGRCLATCSQDQYFDTTSSTCQSCDNSCSSCSGPGGNNCLACSDTSQVLRKGACVAADCDSGTNVVPGLGVCLSELVATPSGTSPPLPSITGLSSPAITTTHQLLQWWEILLMALGCAFIFMVFLWCWRRRARKQRAKATAAFASTKALDNKDKWRTRIMRFFGQSRRETPPDNDEIALWKLRAAEEARHEMEMEKLIGAYQYQRSREGSALDHPRSVYEYEQGSRDGGVHDDRSSQCLSQESMYSQVTGMPRSRPEPRQPIKSNVLTSRFSTTTVGSSVNKKMGKPRTEAASYAAAVRETAEGSPSYWMKPLDTGGSRNPFRQ